MATVNPSDEASVNPWPSEVPPARVPRMLTRDEWISLRTLAYWFDGMEDIGDANAKARADWYEGRS